MRRISIVLFFLAFSLMALPRLLADSKQLYRKGLQLFYLGKISKAAETWNSLLDTQRLSLSGFQLAAIQARLNQARYAASLSREQADSFVAQAAQVCNRAGRYMNSDPAEAKRLSGIALGFLERAVSVASSNKRYLYFLAFALANTGKLKEAEFFAKLAVKRSPKNAQAYNLLAMIFQRQGRHKLWLAALQRSVRLAPDQRDIQYSLCKALLKRGAPGDEEKACAAAEAAIGDNIERAEELEKLFADPALKDRIYSCKIDIAVRRNHERKAKAARGNSMFINTGRSGHSSHRGSSSRSGPIGPPPGPGPTGP